MIATMKRMWAKAPAAFARKGVLGAVLTIGAFSVLVRLISVLKESMVAASFGTSDAFDAFVIATLAPSVIVGLVSNSLNAALIPTYIRVREGGGPVPADRLYSTVLTLNLALLGLLSLLIALATPLWLPWMASGFSPEKFAFTQKLVYWSMPMVVASGLATTWGSVMNAQERFGIVAMAPAYQPIAILLSLALVAKMWGIWALVAGTLLGSALEAGTIGYALWKHGHPIWPRWHGLTDEVKTVLAQYGATIGGAFLINSMGLVDQGMASTLGPGSNSALAYGMKIPMAVVSMGIIALGTAVLPRFSKLVGEEKWHEFRRTLWRYLLVVGALSLLLALILAAGSSFITALLYQRGRFSAEDTALVSRVQMFYLLRLPIPITATLLVRALNAMRANQVLTAIAVLQAILNAALDWVLMKRYGAPGIAASTLGVSMVACVCISLSVWWMLKKRCAEGPSDAT